LMLDFLICFEHVNREVENDALIKFELEKRGYSCEIIPFNGPGFFRHSIYKKAKVVVVPWLRYDDNVFHYLALAKRPFRLVNLQWEQVYFDEDIASGMARTTGQAKKAFHVCWGQNSKKRLMDWGIAERLLAVTGAIQLDYGFPIFNNYFHDRKTIASELKLDEHKRWILMVSSFAYVNYGDAAIKELEAQFGLSLQEQVNLHKTSQSLTLDWIELLLERIDCEFIYRPHPSEKLHGRLIAIKDNYKNFHIISNYSVKQWAKICDRLNIWISTSNAEILSMNVDYAIIRPVPIPEKLEVESMREESFITDCEAFLKYNSDISDPIDNLDIPLVDKMKKLSHFYHYDNNNPAYIHVANYLVQIIEQSWGQVYEFSFKQHIRYGWSEFKKKIISLIMELSENINSYKLIDSLPIKFIIKTNLKNSIENKRKAKLIESRMIGYLEKYFEGEKR